MSYRSHSDLGGRTGIGSVIAGAPEREGEVFHSPWEARALALTLAMGATGEWNIDMSRSARETLPDYPSLSYYQIWIAALERLLAERGLVMPDELAAGHALHASRPVARVLRAAEVGTVLRRGSPTQRTRDDAPRFAPGDVVRTRADPVDHHTRLPGYARGKVGRVACCHGAHVFADGSARGLTEPHWLYTVEFEAEELWGADVPGPGRQVVSIDAWEPYLELA
jgi:nitrile hydratase